MSFFDLNDRQKFSQMPAQRATQHSIISESLQFCLQTGKSLKFHRFESVQNFSFFLDLKFVLVGLFLIYFFIAEADIVINLFLNFEQK